VSAPGTPVADVAGDTIRVTGISAGPADSVTLDIRMTPPDTTATLAIPVLTGTGADSLFPVRTHPTLFIHGIPIPIATAKENDANGVPLAMNKWITVRGVVTVANEFGTPSHIQDNTGGMAIYGSLFSAAVAIGDEVVVSGLVQPFAGLFELVNPVLVATLTHGNAVSPTVVTAAQISGDGAGGVEQYEGLLVRLNGVTVAGAGAWVAATNYTLTDGSGTTQLRIDNNVNLINAPIPTSTFDCVGVVGQYITTSPSIGGYQFMPRTTADIVSTGPIFAGEPRETGITPTGFAVVWSTVHPGTSRLQYGVTPALEMGFAGDSALQNSHRVDLSGLTPATVYYVRAFSVSGVDTSAASVIVVSTASPAEATGAINVYFNTTVDTSVAWDAPANGTQNLVARLLTRINGAQRSIDAALYSLSGTPGPGTDIANALIAAKGRGVSIRMICEADNRNTAPWNSLQANGIPLITDAYDQVNAGAGLMHNKFVVVDGRGGAPESVWVWTGSWNPTDPGTNNDYQNAVEIQDPALAGAYLLEFNEMWGSSGQTPDAAHSRFGARKSDNTPHRFVIGGRAVECYFSPSDRTTSRIASSIDSAGHSIAFGLLTFTRNDLRASLVARKGAGLKVRGILDNNTDTGTQYAALLAGGVDLLLRQGSGYLFHHKYCVIDAEDPSWSPVTITGSHNWSNSAETANNENTLILRDHRIANQFLQEFTARYYQYGGGDSIRVGVEEEPAVPLSTRLERNYPNPFNPATTIQFTLADRERTLVTVYDLLGREVARLVDEVRERGTYRATFDGAGLASGVYLCRMQAGRTIQTRAMLLLK
jgi:phosphatidylserine/phosphatidylglycerophosphate/cardiolipin synthase-like enzyme